MKSFDGSRLKVLVVEDNANFRQLIRTVLGALGITQVVEASDGQDGLDRLKDFSADLALVDWKMEPMDGLAFAQKIRHGPGSPNPFLPIILLTGYVEGALMAEARDAGINEFVQKPISARSIVSHIVAAVSEPRPFVRSDDYFGPDRRRKRQPFSGEERRIQAPVLLLPPRRLEG